MGTRADFYVGAGPQAEWLGSIAWDGYPDNGEFIELLQMRTEDGYRSEVGRILASRDDATLPGDGWPWAWDDSGTTDFAYALIDGRVWFSNFGDPWTCWDEGGTRGATPTFPSMKDRAQVAAPGSKRSGVVMLAPSKAGGKT